MPASGSRKVIAFDSWTGGRVNLERLVKAFAHQGLDLLLIHLGSWGHDPGRPKEENLGCLPARDISYYGRGSFKDILLRERPSAVLFLSTQAFAHRAFNRYCLQLGIPRLHLYHGLIGVQSTASKRLNPVNIRNQLALAWSRLAKNLFRLWPVYARALWQTGAPLRHWSWFGYDVWRQVSGQAYSAVAAPDTATTACCVYTEADISHAVNRYGVPRHAVFVVGNPDLTRFGLREDDIGLCLPPGREATKEIVYIDTALIEAGAVFDDAEDFIRHLQETNALLARQGFQLIVKLHPAHFRTGVPNRLRELRIELCGNDEFVARLKASSGAIVEPSSAALIPALLGLPVLLARYGKLSGQEYGEVLTSYPHARALHSLDGFISLLDDAAKVTPMDATRAWINDNAGPLPAEQMPERVAGIVLKMIKGIEERGKPIHPIINKT
jgi:hypothetical protein